MPRGPRLDAPGALHHVYARGIERRRIFENRLDRDDFVARIARLVELGAWSVYAWALMPNHVHLLVRTRERALEHSMRSLLGGYATSFNRRHERVGHLFQNRYHSTLVEDEPYFLALVRYVHRNPIPSVVRDAASLARYPYSGHATLLGRRDRPWQATAPVLRRFGEERDGARCRYEAFVLAPGRDELPQPGLVRRARAWFSVPHLRRGRERSSGDERILGGRPFVDDVLAELPGPPTARLELSSVCAVVCQALDVPIDALSGSGRATRISQARAAIAYLWTRRLGGSGRALGDRLGLSSSAIYAAARRGARDASRWSELLTESAEQVGRVRSVPGSGQTTEVR